MVDTHIFQTVPPMSLKKIGSLAYLHWGSIVRQARRISRNLTGGSSRWEERREGSGHQSRCRINQLLSTNLLNELGIHVLINSLLCQCNLLSTTTNVDLPMILRTFPTMNLDCGSRFSSDPYMFEPHLPIKPPTTVSETSISKVI